MSFWGHTFRLNTPATVLFSRRWLHTFRAEAFRGRPKCSSPTAVVRCVPQRPHHLAAFAVRLNHTSSDKPASSTPSSPSVTTSLTEGQNVPAAPAEIDPIEPRLSLTFTCTYDECNRRSTHTFTRRAYERGIVIVQCPGCEKRHLIADHIGWFKEITEDGKQRTIEDLLRDRGEKVRRGKLDADGLIQYYD